MSRHHHALAHASMHEQHVDLRPELHVLGFGRVCANAIQPAGTGTPAGPIGGTQPLDDADPSYCPDVARNSRMLGLNIPDPEQTIGSLVPILSEVRADMMSKQDKDQPIDPKYTADYGTALLDVATAVSELSRHDFDALKANHAVGDPHRGAAIIMDEARTMAAEYCAFARDNARQP